MSRPEWQERMFNERVELVDRMTKLMAFQTSAPYFNLEERDRHLLNVQLEAMQSYNVALTERIFRLPRGESNG